MPIHASRIKTDLCWGVRESCIRNWDLHYLNWKAPRKQKTTKQHLSDAKYCWLSTEVHFKFHIISMDLVVNCITDGLLNWNVVNKLLCPLKKQRLQPGSMILSIKTGHKKAFTNCIYPLYKQGAILHQMCTLNINIRLLPDDTVLCMHHDTWKTMAV